MGASDGPIPLVLSVIALVAAIIGVIIAAVSLGQNGTNNYTIGRNSARAGSTGALSDDGDGGGTYSDDRIWTIAIGHSAASTEYLDEVSGQIKGFDVDIVNAVCKIAGKNCRLVADVYQRCWDSVAGETQRGGTGLFAGYYDACTAWLHSYVRQRTFSFSDPFAVVEPSVFFVKPGDSFNPRDVSNKKIGFVDGFIHDEFCLARQDIQGVPMAVENVYHYHTRKDLLNAVLTGEVDAGFDNAFAWSNVDEVEIVANTNTECAVSGRSMMIRKDSTLWQWWNPAFEALRSTTEYRTICKDLLEQHGHIPGPTPKDLCFDY